MILKSLPNLSVTIRTTFPGIRCLGSRRKFRIIQGFMVLGLELMAY